MTHVMAITIGPVQDFISTARRSRDLWFGSWVLSELSKAAANAIVILHHDNARLIFPATEDPGELVPDSQFNVVNRILAVVDDPLESGKVAHDAVQQQLRIIREKAFDRIDDRNNYFNKNKKAACDQVDDLIEFYWAACPFSGDAEYATAREKAERLLIARKSTRSFQPASWSSNAPKSALDGQRESVIDDEAFNNTLTLRELRHHYGLGSGERLCGVGLLKRHGNRGPDDSFFSTSHVASLPLISCLKTQAQRQSLEKYIGELCAALGLNKESSELGWVPHQQPYKPHPVFSRRAGGRKIGYDGHILFPERLGDLLEDKRDKQNSLPALNKAKEALNRFLNDALNGAKPSPYYALLLADGDSMREAINGLKDRNDHREFSKKLSAFARDVSKIVVERHNGSLVYAGGDDVLAFLPLHTVLQCARELASAFSETLNAEKVGVYGPTLSVGVVIAHHMESLQDALGLVREAEKIAKQVDGKNALAITLSKRSGFDTTIKGSWRSGVGEPLDLRLIRFAQLHLADKLPDSAAYELRELNLRLSCDAHEPEHDILQKAIYKEAIRILNRKQIKDLKLVATLRRQMELGRKAGTSVDEPANEVTANQELLTEGTPIGELANQLIVARELARAFELAGMDAEDLDKLLQTPTGESA